MLFQTYIKYLLFRVILNIMIICLNSNLADLLKMVYFLRSTIFINIICKSDITFFMYIIHTNYL